MFVDRARVRVTGGSGGNGCCSFRREKYVPFGGPDGGDGGHGGDVVFVAKSRLTSLLDVQYHSTWHGERGAHGLGSKCHGKRGEDTEVAVPPGTVVKDFESGEVVADLNADGARFVAAQGGRGGKGNARFTTSTQRAPKFAEKGEPGQEAEYLLELKLIAEVGLVGLPNAGKSTFLAAATAATPKIADYPFTTLSPNLGVAQLSDYRTLTIADIPGIIEGASEGKGLGHDFLRHIERNKVLLFVIDLGDEDPVQTHALLQEELAGHSGTLAGRPQIIALNKADLPENRERFDAVRERFSDPFLISAASHEGIDAVLEALWSEVERVRKEEAQQVEPEVQREYTYEAPFSIQAAHDGFRIEGAKVVRAVRMTDFENDQAVRHLQQKLRRMGLFKALQRQGAKEGDTISIADVDLEYHPD